MLPCWKIVAIVTAIAKVKIVAFVAMPPSGYDEAGASFAKISERWQKQQQPLRSIVYCYRHNTKASINKSIFYRNNLSGTQILQYHAFCLMYISLDSDNNNFEEKMKLIIHFREFLWLCRQESYTEGP